MRQLSNDQQARDAGERAGVEAGEYAKAEDDAYMEGWRVGFHKAAGRPPTDKECEDKEQSFAD